MIIKSFNINEINLKYFVGINQIKINSGKLLDLYDIDNQEEALTRFFSIINKVQNNNENSVIQFIKDKYILNQDHIFTACYYLLKAFQQNINISNKKNIEFLLYLAANRQINKSIEAIGIDYSQLIHNKLTLCIISPFENINSTCAELLTILNAVETELTINNQSQTKFNLIKEFFRITDNQINSVLKSYGNEMKKSSETKLSSLFSALFDLICERMALLNAERKK
ncbi:MAG: KEOPS complex subunit Cgi121 [Candidatus Lokiarchaeia archaeon]